MDRSAFAAHLRDAIVGALQEFRDQHADELPYAFAIIEGQAGNYLGFAIPTEEGLRRVAAEYDRRGYRYQGWEWEQFENQDKLAVWLRWANPDDGWHYGDFPDRFQIQQHLHQLVQTGTFGENAEDLEEFSSEVLASLQSDPAWKLLQEKRPVIVGVTAGEDPRDFLRTATRCNPYAALRQLWSEQWQAEESSSRIKSPD